MRVTTGVRIGVTTRRTGVWPRPTVSARAPMRINDRQPLESFDTDEQITIDARDVLAGRWDTVRYGEVFSRE